MATSGDKKRTVQQPFWRLAALIATSAVALTACTSLQNNNSTTEERAITEERAVVAESIDWQPVDFPAESLARTPTYKAVAVLPPTDNAPWVSVLNVYRSGTATKPIFRTSHDGQLWREETPDWGPETDTVSVMKAVTAGDQTVLMVIRYTAEGERTEELWTSTDRISWTKSDRTLPKHSSALQVFDDQWCVVTKPGQRRQELHCPDKPPVVFQAGDDVSSMELLPAASYQGTWVQGTLSWLRDGSQQYHMRTSTDAGKTWSEPELVDFGGGDIMGLVVTEDGFLATGTMRRQAGSWLSRDGKKWRFTGSVVAADDRSAAAQFAGKPGTLTNPVVAADGNVYALVQQPGKFTAAIAQLTTPTSWRIVQPVLLPTDQPSLALGVDKAGTGVLWWAAAGSEEAFPVFSAQRTYPFFVAKKSVGVTPRWDLGRAHTADPTVTFELETSVLKRKEGRLVGYHHYHGGDLLRLNPEGTVTESDLPAELRQEDTLIATSPDGVEVAFGENTFKVFTELYSGQPKRLFEMVGAVRSSGKEWESITFPAVDRNGWSSQSVFYGGGKFVFLARQSEGSGTFQWHALTSENGRDWAVTDQGFEGATATERVHGCQQASGPARAVGYTKQDGKMYLTALVLNGDTWNVQQSTEALSSSAGEVTCLVKDGKTFISVSDRDQLRLFTLSESGEIAAYHDLGADKLLHGATIVGDQFVVYGSDRTAIPAQAASFWTSVDGKKWRQHLTPRQMSDVRCVVPAGDRMFLCGREGPSLSLWSASLTAKDLASR